ncbi:DUF2877 domain-containing protein [Streptomyces sp. NPDC057596]|uniref:oxamate carbamoyltransferase subunit AllH family protein n=1 Tax=Streptomyces sp. NPDC057596 TaxID=3346178 RepID=UPI0036A80427
MPDRGGVLGAAPRPGHPTRPGPRPARHAPPVPATAARGPPRRPRSRAHARHGGTAARRRAARALLGLGPGATPSGDDFLCGLLLAAQVQPRPPDWLAALAHIAAEADSLTPPVSEALLRHAAEGLCIPQVAVLLRAAATGGDPSGPVTALLTVGHSSGCDLLHGLCAGARLATRAREGVRPRSTPS